MIYKIFPPIGIARLGEDEDFILDGERPGDAPGELQADGSLVPVSRYKDATKTRIRKRGARFHLFESTDGTSWEPANLPATATVTWSVELVNKKSAVTRPNNPPTTPTRPQVPAANQPLVINGGTKRISGPSAVSSPFVGQFATAATNGTPFHVDVELGRLQTDAQGRLIVLGGKGFSSAPPGTPLGTSFYKNPRWHDDVADGPVTAEVQLSPTDAPVRAEGGAWVVVAPPDYAPEINPVVSLYDVIRQLGIDKFAQPDPGRPSFDRDVAPILERVRRLRWVHADPTWSDARLDSPHLRDTDGNHQALRGEVRGLVKQVENVFAGHTSPAGPPFRLRAYQNAHLDRWVAGDFDATTDVPGPDLTSEGLTRAALDGAAGQGFFPGIEAGIIVLDETLYQTPFDFRLDQTQLAAGDLTALMAQPWQADFLKCSDNWWPAQRPDRAPQPDGTFEDWVRDAKSHTLLVQRHARLGLVVRQGTGEVFLEVERDPALP